MNRALKIVIAVVGGIIALVVVVAILLLLFFPRDRLREMAETRIELETERPISIGSVSLKFFPKVQAALSDVSFGERAEPGAPKISVDEISLGMKVLPLIAKRFEVTEVVIERPVVEVVLEETPAGLETRKEPERHRPGDMKRPPRRGTRGQTPRGMKEDAAAGEAARTVGAETETAAQQAGVNLKIESVRIRDGRILVRLPNGSPFAEIGDLDETLSVEATEEGDLRLVGETRIGGISLNLPTGRLGEGIELRLEKSLQFDAGDDRLTIEKAELDLSGLPIAVTGSISGVQSEKPSADLSLEGGPGDVSDILGLVPAGLAPEMDDMTSSGTLSLRARVTGDLTDEDGPDFDVSLQLADGRVSYPAMSREIESIELKLDVRPDTVRIHTFSVRTGKSHLHAKALVSGYRTAPLIDADVDAALDLSEIGFFHPAAETLGLGGTIQVDLHAEGDATDADNIGVYGTVRADGVSVSPPSMAAPVRDLNGSIRFNRDEVKLEGVTALIGSGDLRAEGTLRQPMLLVPSEGESGRAHVSIDIRSRRLNLDELMVVESDEAAGRVSPPGRSGRPRTRADEPTPKKGIPPLPPLDGVVTFKGDEIIYKGIPATNVDARLTLDRGIVTLDDVTARAFEGGLALDGTMDLTDPGAPTFDVGASVTDARAEHLFASVPKLSRFGELAGVLSGGITTEARFSGSLDDTLGLDLAALIADGNMDIEEAMLKNHPVQNQLAGFLKTPDLNTLAVNEWSQAFRISNGRVEVQDLRLGAGDIEVTAGGWQSLDGSVEMSFDLWLPPEYVGAVRGMVPAEVSGLLFGGDDERFLVPVKLSGKSPSPKVSLDRDRLVDLAAVRAEQRLAEEKAKVGESIRDEGEDLLRDLLGKDDADSTDGKKELKDKLRSIFD